MSLRARLLVGMVVLVAAGLAATAIVTYEEQRSFLLDRVDQQVASALVPLRFQLVARAADGRQGDGTPLPQRPPFGRLPGAPSPVSTLPPGTFGEILSPSGKAVGARRSDILIQFLVEAVLVSLFGGIAGVLAGILGTAIRMTDRPAPRRSIPPRRSRKATMSTAAVTRPSATGIPRSRRRRSLGARPGSSSTARVRHWWRWSPAPPASMPGCASKRAG